MKETKPLSEATKSLLDKLWDTRMNGKHKKYISPYNLRKLDTYKYLKQ